MPRERSGKRLTQLRDARASKQARLQLEENGENFPPNLDPAVTNGEEPSCLSRTAKKLELMKISDDDVSATDQKWFLMHIDQMNALLKGTVCSVCFKPSMKIDICAGKQQGFATRLSASCSNCGQSEETYSSPRLQHVDSHRPPFEVNRRMTVASHELGSSHSALQKVSNVLGMPCMHLKTFQSHDRTVTDAEESLGQDALNRAATAVREAHRDLLQEEPADGILDVAVSFDGTWHKRGFTSLYGVGIVIELQTGLILDFALLSKYCHACQLHKNLPVNEFDEWHQQHAAECCINHQGSSKAMEQEAAKIMWGRSVERHRLRYTQMLSDGDSCAFKAVCDLAPYGEIPVTKLECLNHAHKRLGTALRQLTKTEKLGGRGDGRLTEKKCESLQNYYRGAVLDNLDSTEKMRSSIWSTFFHCISTDEKPTHHRCPPGEDSWCWYQKAIAQGDASPSHADHPSHTKLTLEVAEKMIPVYRRMSDESLLARLTHGGTQNANEAFNSQIWIRCPKTTFMGKRRVEGAISRAVGLFNEGALDLARVMNSMWLDISSESVKALKRRDQKRIRAAEKAATDAAKKKRKDGVAEVRERRRAEHAAEGQVYGAGMAD